MVESAYSTAAAKRIAHVRAHLEGGFPNLNRVVSNIENNTGSPKGSASNLARHAEAKAISSWFEYNDIRSMRQWCYVAARLQMLIYRFDVDTLEPGWHMLQLMKPLLSNNRSVIDWIAHYDGPYDLGRVEDHKTRDFRAYQAIIALRGDWPRLLERCERVLSDPPGASSEQKYLDDHKFFLALARQDKSGMEGALRALVSSRAFKSRSNDESGYTADLISTAAVIYAKIAWLHGLEVQVDSPYIPAEWLPNTPLESYDNHYSFLA
jgi:Immunity protein 49